MKTRVQMVKQNKFGGIPTLTGVCRNAADRLESSFLVKRIFLLFCMLSVLSSCMSIVYYEGRYHGKVIDSKTMQPIAGAVVLGVWYKVYHTAGGEVTEFYDSRETLTDNNGEFKIEGMGPRAMTHLGKMDIVIFKVGYEDVSLTSWESLKNSIYYGKRVKWESDKAIIPLDKWNIEQRRRRFDPSVGAISDEKQAMLLEAIKREKHEIK